MQKLAQIIDEQGLQPDAVPEDDKTELPTEPNEVQSGSATEPNGTKPEPKTVPESEEAIAPLHSFDDKKGKYTITSVAKELGLTLSGLRKSRLPFMVEAVGGDETRIRPGKLTDLARHLLRLHADRPEEMSSESWVASIQQRFVDESPDAPGPELPDEDAIASQSEVVAEAEEILEGELVYQEEQIHATHSHSALMLQQVLALQQSSQEYGALVNDQELVAARERGYNRKLQIILAEQQGAQQAIRDTQPQRPAISPVDQHFDNQKLKPQGKRGAT